MSKDELITMIEEFVKSNIPSTRERESYLVHVFGVRKYALMLAKLYNANELVLEVASLIHDVGAYVGPEHAEESAKIAEELLSKTELPKKIVEQIINCIKHHSLGAVADNIEEQIMQDADGLIFLEDTYKSFYDNRKKQYPESEARAITIKKVKAMMNKIKTEEGIRLAKGFLEKALKEI